MDSPEPTIAYRVTIRHGGRTYWFWSSDAAEKTGWPQIESRSYLEKMGEEFYMSADVTI
jgi:hypothetical protein